MGGDRIVGADIVGEMTAGDVSTEDVVSTAGGGSKMSDGAVTAASISPSRTTINSVPSLAQAQPGVIWPLPGETDEMMCGILNLILQ